LVVEKVVDSRYRYNINTDVADASLGIGDPMQLVTDSKVSIELLDIDWHKFPTDANNGSRWKLNGLIEL
jgi:hypothetical protein